MRYISHNQTLSVNVLTKLSELIDGMSNPEGLNAQLVDLAKQHKNRGTTRAHFDVSILKWKAATTQLKCSINISLYLNGLKQNLAKVLVDFLAANLGAAFTPEAKQAWTTTMQGINTVIEAAA